MFLLKKYNNNILYHLSRSFKEHKLNASTNDNVTSGLHPAQQLYMKRIERENAERVMKLKRIRKNNIITGLCLASAVFGIYFYSIFSIKQEDFLDEIDQEST